MKLRRSARPHVKTPDDRMTLVEHLAELRSRIIKALLAITVGALVMFDYSIAFTFAALFLVACAALRNVVLAGLLAFALTPLALFAADYSLTSVFGVSALALLILIAHRKNIPEEIHKLVTGRKLKSDKRAVPRQP